MDLGLRNISRGNYYGRKTYLRTVFIILTVLIINFKFSYTQIIINEVCPSNEDVIADIEGDFGDWIEIFNAGNEAENLLNYRLSDDPLFPDKWIFPEYIIEPGEYLVVFASGKNIIIPPAYWQTIINRRDECKFLIPGAGTSTSWRLLEFDDASWSVGPTGIGYGDGDDATIIPHTISVYLRKSFFIEDTSIVHAIRFHMDFDDGFVAYINGVEVARAGMNGYPPAYNSAANSGREALIYSGGSPNSYDISNKKSLFKEGNNVLAVEVHNDALTSTDLTAIPFLSLLTNKRPLEDPPLFLELSNSGFHTSFKLDADGDSLYLRNPLGKVIDSLYISQTSLNHSYGRKPLETSGWYLFNTPTPGRVNNTASYLGYVNDLPIFSTKGGRYPESFQLTLTAPQAGDSIYYTIDGSYPEISASRYQNSITISGDMVVRARIIKKEYISVKSSTNTYYQKPFQNLPVLCISTDPDNLWDYYEGIYTKGPNAENNFPYFGANFWEDWERPAHIELFDENGSNAFSLDAGIKIYGGWTRGHPQKSVVVFAREKYDAKKISYQLFPDLEISEFESFVFRNSGNDWYGSGSETGTMFRDVLMTRLTNGMEVDHLASRQAIIYINGEYWGIQNIREKINEHFLSSHHGVDPDQIDLLQGDQEIIQGSSDHYLSMLNFIYYNDLSISENYEYVKTQMDVGNFINYHLAQIYYDNKDWPGNNIKFWRPATASGKWRWIMYDTDFGFGLWDPNNVNNNTLLYAMEEYGPSYPNPPWSTFLLRKLNENLEFRELFINSFADRINTNFSPDSVKIKVYDLRNAIGEEIQSHTNKWGGSYQTWINQTNELIDFSNKRPDIVRNHIRSKFGLTGTQNLTLQVSFPEAGTIKLNTIFVKSFPWTGKYFQGNFIELTAIPKPGYIFTGWSGAVNIETAKIRVNLNAATTIIANFEIVSDSESKKVLINEICYKSDPANNTDDWVELFNNSDQYLDISEWILKDSDDSHRYSISPGTLLKPYGYHVFCREKDIFSSVHPNIRYFQGNFDFGFSSTGESIRLYNAELELIDSVQYGAEYPWPLIPDGSGLTLALFYPNLDNSLASSWGISIDQFGSPGRNNSYHTDIDYDMTNSKMDVLFQNIPNPFNYSTRIVFYSEKQQLVNISIYDLNGRLIKVLANEILDNAYHEFEWVPEMQEENMYILKAQTPEAVYTKKIIKW